MQAREYYLNKIQQEFAVAREAVIAGNDGKARVCARRAAGLAIQWFLSKNPRSDWQTDAMSQLRHLQDDETFSREVHDAARRLTTRISDHFEYSSAANPIEDATMIVNEITKILDHDADR